MPSLTYQLIWLARLAAAIVISFLLFTAVSMLHAAFEPAAKNAQQARRISAMEIIRKPPEEKKVVTQRIRQLQQPTNEGKSMQGQMAMRFTPDLSVDASAQGGAGVALQKQELSAEVFEQGQVDEPAQPDYTPGIPYPERAADLGIKGEVEVQFVVTHQGKVTDVQVTKTPSPLFVEDVKRGVSQWRFKPAKNKGIPVNQRCRKVIQFNLD